MLVIELLVIKGRGFWEGFWGCDSESSSSGVCVWSWPCWHQWSCTCVLYLNSTMMVSLLSTSGECGWIFSLEWESMNFEIWTESTVIKTHNYFKFKDGFCSSFQRKKGCLVWGILHHSPLFPLLNTVVDKLWLNITSPL